MVTFNANNNNISRENKILFHSILHISQMNNISVDKSKLYDAIKSNQFKLHLNHLTNTLLLKTNYDDFELTINNVSVDTLKKCRATAKLRTSLDSISM